MSHKEKSNIVLMATYWNEIDWVETSLDQIKNINPRKVIICDGCFDPKYPNYSEDGTREKIENFCKTNNNVLTIDAIRKTKFEHTIDWLTYKDFKNHCFIPKLLGLIRLLKTNIYRLNQSATFQFMLDKLSALDDNDWFMTYDCDQFYSDEIINLIKDIDSLKDYNIITSNELTFFESFESYTDEYEKRDYNNMPHRFKSGMRFIPTRHPALIKDFQYYNYSDIEKNKFFGGEVFHYKFKNIDRMELTYKLGDRKSPEKSKFMFKKFIGQHPKVIQSILKS